MTAKPRPFTSHVKMIAFTLILPHAGRWFYQREIHLMMGIAYTPVRAALIDLEAFGLLTKRTHGNRQYYTVDKTFFLYDEYKRIVLKTVGLGDHLRYRIKQPADIDVAFVYGDFAQGSETTDTPIRFCCIGNLSKAKIHEAVNAAKMFTHKEFEFIQFKAETFTHPCQQKDPELARALASPKIILAGTKERIEALCNVNQDSPENV